MALMLRFIIFRQKFYYQSRYEFKYNEKKIENKLFVHHTATYRVGKKTRRVYSIRNR